MNFRRILLLYCILLIPVTNLIGQNIKGKVTGINEKGVKEPLPGVNVFWEGTITGTLTDSTGVFQLPDPPFFPAKLVVGIIGFKTNTITVKEPRQEDLVIELKSVTILKEVNVEARQQSTSHSTFNPINTEIISSKELLKAACCNLSESFSTNASVDVAFTDAVSGAKKIQMLGLDGVYTQILSENIPMIRGLFSGYGLNYIPGTWIENILVTKGTGSVVNGYESISGQINLEFLKPEEQKKRFFINIYANEKSRLEANLHLSKKLNDKWSTMLFLHSSDLSKKNDMNMDSFVDMPLVRQYNLFNRWDFHNGKNREAQLGVKALMDDRRSGQLSSVTNQSSHGTLHNTYTPYKIRIKAKSLEYFSKNGFMFPSQPFRSIGIQTSGKWQQQDMYFGLRKYFGEQKSFYANVIFQDIVGTTNHKYKFGGSYLLDDYSELFIDSAFFRQESVPGIFAEYTYTYPDDFSLVLGIRADYHNLFGMQYVPRLHLRYNITKSTTLRLSGGRGFRTSNIFIENQTVFASSRKVEITERLRPEVAWNYGISINQKFKLFGNEAFINVDFFKTDFKNQVITDLDQHVNKVFFYNLNGSSYSHSLQADFGFSPAEMFDMKLAYKWYDVKSTYNNTLLDKPYIPKHRVMLNMAYATYKDIWKFDFTTNWLGQSRIPNTSLSPVTYRLPAKSKSYFILQAQITKKFRKFELYLGCENLLNYTQPNPIVAADNPFGNNFDASMIYAPVDGRIIYTGLRLSIK